MPIKLEGKSLNEKKCAYISVALILMLIGSFYFSKFSFSLADSNNEKPLQASESTFTFNVASSPSRIQEGLNTLITIGVQGENNAVYTLRTNVTNPAGNFSFVDLDIETNATGFGNSSLWYWSNFTNADTNLVGVYNVYLQNATTNQTLASSSFTVGLTDKVKYARNETANIRGSGYGTNESATINIKLNEMQIAKQNVTASITGIVNYTWRIPENATPGVYTVSITSAASPGTVKNPPDVQDFHVEVWTSQIQARNLANEPVVNLTIKVYNNTIVPVQFLNLSQPTNETGWSSFMLATGNYTFKAFWKQVEVGTFPPTNIKNDTVLEEDWIQLSNLKINVKDEATNESLPFIQLRLEYNYTTEANENITETRHFETNFTGTIHIHNLFINVSYVVEAERYGLSLSPIQNKTSLLPWNTLTIKFPVYTAFIHVVDSKNNPVEGFRVEAYEWRSGLTQHKATDSNGNVTFSLTFGRYRVKVYNATVLLKEITVNLTRNRSSFPIYLSDFNIDFTVAVVDYFGQPIPNAMVKIERNTGITYEVTAPTGFTGPDGHITFSSVLGGNSRISIYIGGQLSGTKDLYLTNSEQVTFNLNSYVVIAGYAVETSQFLTAISLAMLIVAFIVALTYKRLYKILKKSK